MRDMNIKKQVVRHQKTVAVFAVISSIVSTIIKTIIAIIIFAILATILAHFVPEMREKIPSLYLIVDLIFSYIERFFNWLLSLFH